MIKNLVIYICNILKSDILLLFSAKKVVIVLCSWATEMLSDYWHMSGLPDQRVAISYRCTAVSAFWFEIQTPSVMYQSHWIGKNNHLFKISFLCQGHSRAMWKIHSYDTYIL